MYKNKSGFSLIEMMISSVIILLLTMAAIPYYQNAIEATYMTEGTLLWNYVRRYGEGQDLTYKKNRMANELNENRRFKHFNVTINCRVPPEEETEEAENKKEENAPVHSGLCWEAELSLQDPNQRIRYYLTTQHNFSQLLCVPLNEAGDSFCQSQALKEHREAIAFLEKEAYILHN